MSNTEVVNEQPEDLVPVAEIKRFPLNDGAFGRVHKGTPDSHIPKEAIPYILREFRFIDDPEQEQEPWHEELMIAVGRGRQECPFCLNGQKVEHKRVGPVTGIRVTQSIYCRCKLYRNFYSRWYNPANVAENYTHIRLETLESKYHNFKGFNYDPDKPDAPSSFKDLLETVRKYKNNCFLLTGKAGTGKTTLLTAMYHRALMDWAIRRFEDEKVLGIESVWKVDATSLAKQQRDWAMRGEGRDAETGQPAILPTVTKNKVLEAVRYGLVPHLFLDEFDKIKLDSSFQLNEFSEIIDAIQSNGGQVVACTNMSVLPLKYALGNQHGEAIIRRLVGPRMNEKNPEIAADPTVGGFLVDCTVGTIVQNYQLPSAPVSEDSKDSKAEVGPQYRKKTTSDTGVSRTTSVTPASPSPAATSRRGNAKGAFTFDGSIRHRKG